MANKRLALGDHVRSYCIYPTYTDNERSLEQPTISLSLIESSFAWSILSRDRSTQVSLCLWCEQNMFSFAQFDLKQIKCVSCVT